jgi:phosphoglycerate dehydrogenase-like enzyme
MTAKGKHRIAMSGDFRNADGSAAYPEFDVTPLSSRPDVELFHLENRPVIAADQVENVDVLIISDAVINEGSFHADGQLAAIARFGVGYDKVDVAACSRNSVGLVITPDGVRRPVAVAILTLIRRSLVA